jgi:hypothetical protein
MSVIIIGGNERMERLYAETCFEHGLRGEGVYKSQPT